MLLLLQWSQYTCLLLRYVPLLYYCAASYKTGCVPTAHSRHLFPGLRVTIIIMITERNGPVYAGIKQSKRRIDQVSVGLLQPPSGNCSIRASFFNSKRLLSRGRRKSLLQVGFATREILRVLLGNAYRLRTNRSTSVFNQFFTRNYFTLVCDMRQPTLKNVLHVFFEFN